MRPITNPIPTDESVAHDAIERWMGILSEAGWVATDAEPGEWARMTNPATGEWATITPEGPDFE